MEINKIWESNNHSDWSNLISTYWDRVRENHMGIEKELNNINVEILFSMTPENWYDFLYNKYYFWKYTAPNRLVTTRNQLIKYKKDNALDELDEIRKKIIQLDTDDIKESLETAKEIKGLGVSGASGLLSLIYSDKFGSVDQFLVKSLRNVESKKNVVQEMNPENLSVKNGVILIRLLREKANLLNLKNETDFWTPRKIDMALWANRD